MSRDKDRWELLGVAALLSYNRNERESRRVQQNLVNLQQQRLDFEARSRNPQLWAQIQRERAEARRDAQRRARRRRITGIASIAILGSAGFFWSYYGATFPGHVPSSSTPPPAVSAGFAPASGAVAAAPSAPAPAPAFISMNEVRPVLSDSPLYEQADESSSVLDRIHVGARVRVVGETGDFFAVRKLNGVVGFAPRNSIGEDGGTSP